MIIGRSLAHLRQQRIAGFLSNEEARTRRDVEHGPPDQCVAPYLPKVFVEVVTDACVEPDALFIVRLGAKEVGLHEEYVATNHHVAIEEIRIGDRGRDGTALLRQYAVDAGGDPSADQVLFA